MKTTAPEATRAAQLTALLADAPKPDDHDGVREYLHGLAALGCAPLLIYPNSKTVADARTARQRNADDKTAQVAAREVGRRNWQRVKSPAGVYLATDDPAVLDTYLTRYTTVHGGTVAVNVAVSVGRSRLVVVDCDTADQLAAFLADIDADPATAPTVRTPGARTERGEWIHKDGGHFWFTVPEGVELPGGTEYRAEGGYSVFWGSGRYALLPPSVRAEGGYTMPEGGAVHALPVWLADRITERAPAVRPVADRAVIGSGTTLVDDWSRAVDWGEILGPLDWTPTGRLDTCGCETWTAPGEHASPKSATGHEPGCAEPRYNPDNPPFHIWTDNPGEPFAAYVAERRTQTLSKLQAVALIDFDNDTGAAMDALGLISPQTLDAGQDVGRAADSEAGAGRRGLRITWASEIEPEPVPWLWVDVSARNIWSPDSPRGASPDPFDVEDIACIAPGHEWSPPEVETDGRIACGMVSIAAGREGSGKSSFGIWLTAKITCGALPGAHYGTPKRVFYLATEDSWKHTLVPRLIAAGADMSKIGRVEVVVQEGATVTLSLPDDTELLTQEIGNHDVALVVIDPLMSTMGAGLDTNGTRDVRTALEPLAAMADRTGASVVAIAHFNKATGLDSLSRISGSGAFKDVARAVMVFATAGDERVFTQPKNSVGRSDLPSLNYEIRQAVVDTPTGKTSTAVFRFTGIAERSVDDVLDDERGRGRRKSQVMTFLVDYLTEHADTQTGEVDATEVIAAGEARGHTRKQIIDARSRSTDPEIGTRKEGFGKDARNFWTIAQR